MSIITLKNKIFVLGAGASVDYGLPTWGELTLLIKKYLSEKIDIEFKDEILEWVDLVDNKYDTIDECIHEESKSKRYKENGQEIEFQIFKILELIFKEKGKENDDGWISRLNEKIRKKEGIDWEDIFFINYNYDAILADNILNFKYLSKKERQGIFRPRIQELTEAITQQRSQRNRIPCLCPHGLFENLFENIENLFLSPIVDTINSHDHSIPQSVSCYDGKTHNITLKSEEVSLYILGLGRGLEINLKKIIFDDNSKIKNISITIRKDNNMSEKDYENRKKGIINFLTKHFHIDKENISVFNDCLELIEKSFSS